MTSTTFDFNQLQQPAMPHGKNLQGDYVAMPVESEKWTTSIRPAGALWSNVHDMAQYILMELNNGVNAQGERVISQVNLLERRKSQIKITDKMSYGLGLMIEDDYGVTCVHHGGNTLGFTAQMMFLPDHNVGFVILTNARKANIFVTGVQRKLMELLFDGKDQAEEMIAIGYEQNRNVFKKNLESVELHPQAAWLEKFVGTYAHPVLGMIEIRQDREIFILDARDWQGTCGQKKEEDGTLKLMLVDGLLPGFDFISQENEAGLVIRLIFGDGQHGYIFERQ